MSRSTLIRTLLLGFALTLTALIGTPVRQAEAATCCELAYQDAVQDCGAAGVAYSNCVIVGRTCKIDWQCNF
jgi:hypothetical protein